MVLVAAAGIAAVVVEAVVQMKVRGHRSYIECRRISYTKHLILILPYHKKAAELGPN